MKVGIIGVGVVGSAVVKSFTELGINIVAYDKFKNIGKIEDILDTSIVFLCLPTLYCQIKNSYDKDAIHEICNFLQINNYTGHVVIKSTIEPSTTQKLADTYNLCLYHNPEFLTARTAYDDFHNQDHIVIGRSSRVSDQQNDELVNFFKKYYPSAKISVCTSTESESVKIFCNCFYAVKIQFFNELYLLCQKLGTNYDTILEMMLKNNWINPMHTQVPGTDGNLSYGGMCFPKDTNALLSFMQATNSPHSILQATVTERNLMRQD